MQVPYAGAAMPNTFNVGCGGQGGRGGQGGQIWGGGHVQRSPFTHHMNNQTQGRGGLGNNGVISWLISVIVNARSQLERAKRDKLEGDDDDVSK